MSLFPPPGREPARGPRLRGARLGWALLSAALIATVTLSFVPSPYVIQQPGPVVDTLGEVEVDGKEVPLITADAPTYSTQGSLSLLTVSVVGSRETRPNWFEVTAAWLNGSKAVLPLDSVYPPGTSFKGAEEANRIEMANSKNEAIAAALIELGHEVPSVLTVAEVLSRPAAGVLESGDRIVSVGGEQFADVASLRARLADHGTQSPIALEVLRAGELVTLELTPQLGDGPQPAPMIGVSIRVDFDFPFDVGIQLENIGGPSAGMMFALGTIDTLTPGAMTGGEHIAGTGTITSEGLVGPIGGIRQKMHGAKNAGSNWFLAPTDNCGEVVGNIPGGLTVFAVATLDEALAAVEGVAAGATEGLATCG